MNLTRARLPLLLLAGALLSLAFPAPDVAPLAWIGIAPLLLAVRGESMRTGFLFGTIFGIGFFGALLIWISLVGWVGWAILVLLQASFIGLFGLVYSQVGSKLGGRWALVAAPTLWITFDWLRSMIPVGGFTWGQLAQSQHELGWMLRPASIGGGWLITFLLVLVNALAVFAIDNVRGARALNALIAVGAAASLIVGPSLLPVNDATGATAGVAIIQGDVPRVWTGTFFEKDLAILQSHTDLTKKLDTSNVDFIVWPESSVGIDPETTPEVAELVVEAAQSAGVPIVAGGNSDAGEGNYKVMAFQVGPEGVITDRYQKTHLVPFGEYVPARDLLDWIPMLDQIPTDAVAATEPTIFQIGGPVAPVLSFEGDFGSLVRDRIGRGGRLLLVITNTSTWGDTWASAQHLAFSQLRAVENGVWVVHAAISGISAFVAPDGTVKQATDLWTQATLKQDLRFAEDASFYARTGDWLPIGCVVASILLTIGTARRPRRPVAAAEG